MKTLRNSLNITLIFLPLLVLILAVFGYIKNVIWMFNQGQLNDIILGGAGVLVPPVGIIHGLWLLF